ncbi:hypothetical protein HY003_03010 [Candidatus Saccharibacteria bacterium]|nr:hypothetical protein [Candidatus Saccharibacteria bacterium]MBI3338244.1 hypothetical protein [Candidatus Saccharibacteria bacterium]
MIKKNNVITKRDWAILVLFLAIIGTNLVWYYQYRQQDKLNNAYWTNFSAHQIEINKLQACLNENTRPCEITPTVQDINN